MKSNMLVDYPLTFITLWADSTIDKFVKFFLFFPGNRI